MLETSASLRGGNLTLIHLCDVIPNFTLLSEFLDFVLGLKNSLCSFNFAILRFVIGFKFRATFLPNHS